MSLSLEDEIVTYLAAATLSTDLTAGTNLFSAQFPDDPDFCVGVIATGGLPPILTLTGGATVGNPLAEPNLDRASFQVRLRTVVTDYLVGQALTQSIYKALQGITETKINGSSNALFHLITAIQPPKYLGSGEDVDRRQRPNWTQNYMAWWDNPAR